MYSEVWMQLIVSDYKKSVIAWLLRNIDRWIIRAVNQWKLYDELYMYRSSLHVSYMSIPT